MTRRHVVQRLHPVLTDVLNRLDGSALGGALKDRAVEVATEQSLALAEPLDRAGALAAHRWLLERAAGDGLPLTAAGYLKPDTVREFAAVLPTMRTWPFAVGREVDVHPVFGFREYLKSVGLLRKYKGTLRLSRPGRLAQQDPDVLWQHLAGTLVPNASAFDETAGVVVLVHMATTQGRIDLDTIAQTMTELGWSHQDGSAVEPLEAHGVWNDLWDALGNVGEPVSSSVLGRDLGAAARALAQDALFEVVQDSTVT